MELVSFHKGPTHGVLYWYRPKSSKYGFHAHFQVFYNLTEPVDEKEECTKRIKVSPAMTPQDVVTRILEDKRSSLSK